jgi:hypothetical protein
MGGNEVLLSVSVFRDGGHFASTFYSYQRTFTQTTSQDSDILKAGSERRLWPFAFDGKTTVVDSMHRGRR